MSSRQPWEANNCESGEKDKLLTPTLCNFNRCLIYRAAKSHITTSAENPGKDFCALARYLPSFEILIALIDKKRYLKYCYHVLSRKFEFAIGCVWRQQSSQEGRQCARCQDGEVTHHRCCLNKPTSTWKTDDSVDIKTFLHWK